MEDQGESPEQIELIRLSRCPSFQAEKRQARINALIMSGIDPITPTVLGKHGIEMALIPPGIFLIGSPESEKGRLSSEGPQRLVAITKPFYLGVYPVTQRQWQEVMGSNPSHFSASGRGRDRVSGMDTGDFPVENVSWLDCQKFIEKLNEDSQGLKYRLPTEAEWEYACRGGPLAEYQAFNFGNTASSHQANFDGNYPYGEAAKGPYLQRTCKVGSYRPNMLGLYDMHGNVWEWCQDWYSESAYEDMEDVEITTDPDGPDNGAVRVLRGGAWYNFGSPCRTARRIDSDTPDSRRSGVGFRLAADHDGPETGVMRVVRGCGWYGSGQYSRSTMRGRSDPGGQICDVGFRAAADPTGPDDGVVRVLRGGSCFCNGESCRSADRDGSESDNKDYFVGFRLAADPTGPPDDIARVIRGGCWDDSSWFSRSASRTRAVPDGQYRSIGLRVAADPTGPKEESEGANRSVRGGSWVNYGCDVSAASRNRILPTAHHQFLGLRLSADPQGPQDGIGHVLRGGGWYNYSRNCRSVYRISARAGFHDPNIGFRLAAD